MLVVRRRAGESILIGEEIEVEILEISNNRVKLGIKAPKAIGVLRKEVEMTRNANESAAESDAGLARQLLALASKRS